MSHELPQPMPGDPSEMMSSTWPAGVAPADGPFRGTVCRDRHRPRVTPCGEQRIVAGGNGGVVRQAIGLKIVEPAHMTLAEPSLQTAFERAVSQGARLVLVFPFFCHPVGIGSRISPSWRPQPRGFTQACNTWSRVAGIASADAVDHPAADGAVPSPVHGGSIRLRRLPGRLSLLDS